MAERRRLAERIGGIRNERDGRKVEKMRKKRKEREKYGGGSSRFIQRSDLSRWRIRKRRGKEKSAGVGR